MKIKSIVIFFLMVGVLGIQCLNAQQDSTMDDDPVIANPSYMIRNNDRPLHYGTIDYMEGEIIVIDDNKFFLADECKVYSKNGTPLAASSLSKGKLVGFERDSGGKINGLYLTGEEQ